MNIAIVDYKMFSSSYVSILGQTDPLTLISSNVAELVPEVIDFCLKNNSKEILVAAPIQIVIKIKELIHETYPDWEVKGI